jgi:hypothetical protein
MAARRVQTRRNVGSGPWPLLDAALHELAQPAASAGLALDTALAMLEGGDTESAMHKLRAASGHLRRQQDQMAALGAASDCRGRQPAVDLSPLLSETVPGLADLPPVVVAANEAVLAEALQRIGRWWRARSGGQAAQLSRDGGAVVLTLTGDASMAPSPGLRLWLAALRRCGVTVAVRSGETTTRITLRLPHAGRHVA